MKGGGGGSNYSTTPFSEKTTLKNNPTLLECNKFH